MIKIFVKKCFSEELYFNLVRYYYIFRSKIITLPDLIRITVKKFTHLGSVYLPKCIFIKDGGNPAEVDAAIEYCIKKQINLRDKLPSISAVFRVKNGSKTLELSILSIAPLCKEIIIVDNNSNDCTLEISNDLKKRLSNITEIKIYSYNNKVELPGSDYKKRVAINRASSLAAYYNYCFSKATGEYVFKMDSHKIMTPFGINKIQESLRDCPDILYFNGDELYGRPLGKEPYIYKRALQLKYEDGENWEYLEVVDKKKFRTKVLGCLFLHIKSIQYVASIGSKLFGQSSIYDNYPQSKI